MSQQALSGATAKLSSWQPYRLKVDERELEQYRQIAIQAVFSKWSREHKATDLLQIYNFTKAYVQERIRLKEWPHATFVRGKRFVDRRVNEAASPLYAKDGVPKIVAVTSGIYQPNPALFKESHFNGVPTP